MKSFQAIAGALVALFIVLSGAAVQAEERINRFVSTVEVAESGLLTVTETISVRAEGNQIKRGIYRDIPLRAEGADGRTYRVGFKLLSVLQDGSSASYFVRDSSDGVRIYIGDENVFLQPGNYTYTIEYETDRQIRFFNNHDEVYWNATGNEWNFPIDEALARVVLPEGVRAQDWTAYTGSFGSTAQNYEARLAENGREVIFTTTSPLSAYQGLTVVVSMPKGTITPPSDAAKFGYFLQDNRSELIGGAGVLLVLVYYLAAWLYVGRDPAKGVIYPRFNPPAGVSPALSRYVTTRGFSDGGWIALAAASLNLAVKKQMRLDEKDGDVVLALESEHASARRDLPKGEAAIVNFLEGRGSSLQIYKGNGSSIKTLGTKFRSAIEGESRNVFFKNNRAFLIPGALLSIVAIVLLFALGQMPPDQQEFAMVFMFMSIFAAAVSVNIGKAIFRISNMQIRMALIFALFVVAMVTVGLFAGNITGGITTLPILPVVAASLLALNVLFFFLLGAPTALGRQVLDEVEGLKLYLSVAEKERLNMAEAPDMSTTHFEELLPYAVALGVEKPWSRAFEGWLATAAGAAAAASYHPYWYSGRRFEPSRVSDTLGRTASSMAQSFQSSLPVPKSSSSGFSSSGGSSGGGGGGGGGGGW
ncbi:DUF2207 domain-containing protein [Roseibium sp.]|uniref:DUF2207 domain-containing protein n=2 Tax=unclassified Roseibium TaxID=2629323 RepID=UPI003BAAF923